MVLSRIRICTKWLLDISLNCTEVKSKNLFEVNTFLWFSLQYKTSLVWWCTVVFLFSTFVKPRCDIETWIPIHLFSHIRYKITQLKPPGRNPSVIHQSKVCHTYLKTHTRSWPQKSKLNYVLLLSTASIITNDYCFHIHTPLDPSISYIIPSYTFYLLIPYTNDILHTKPSQRTNFYNKNPTFFPTRIVKRTSTLHVWISSLNFYQFKLTRVLIPTKAPW